MINGARDRRDVDLGRLARGRSIEPKSVIVVMIMRRTPADTQGFALAFAADLFLVIVLD